MKVNYKKFDSMLPSHAEDVLDCNKITLFHIYNQLFAKNK